MSRGNDASAARPRVPYRELNGLVLLDKPLGLSSNQALQRVRRLFRAKKAGHTGALDPLASGMLPICFGESTRLAGLLLDADKIYLTTAQLGARSSTGDSEGELLDPRPVPTFGNEQIDEALRGFRGAIEQIPPMYSALKHQGQALYTLARQGKEVERKPRGVFIHRLDLIAQRPSQLDLEVHCSKGTYIRTLVEDLGERLGCGAYVRSLRRTWVSGFVGQTMYTLADLEAMSEPELTQCLLPTEAGLSGLPEATLSADQTRRMLHGQSLRIEAEPAESAIVFGADRRLLAVASIEADGRLKVKARFGTKSAHP